MDATRFEAIIFDSSGWGVAAAGLEEALRARCDDLRAAGMAVHDVDSGDAGAIAEIAASLAAKGITGRLIAVVGDKLAATVDVPELRRAVHTPTPDDDAGYDSLIRLLDHQLALRADRRVPAIDDDPSWVVPLPADPVMDRVSEALGTLANGSVGVRGRREDRQPAAVSPMLVSGVYTDADGQPRLLAAPDWTALDRRRLGRWFAATRPEVGSTAAARSCPPDAALRIRGAARCDGTARRGPCFDAGPPRGAGAR